MNTKFEAMIYNDNKDCELAVGYDLKNMSDDYIKKVAIDFIK